MRKYWRAAAVIVAIMGAAGVLGPSRGRADGAAPASLRGTWGFSASGTVLPPAFPAPTPAVAVGRMSFDPHSSDCMIEDTINLGGTSLSRTSSTCTYAVGPGGLGTIAVTFPGDPAPTPLSFVLVDKDREMRFIRTDLGVAEGVAKLQ